MKIYISEKYLDLELISKSDVMVVGSDFDILSPVGADGGKYVLAEVQEDAEVKTLEQHEEEIRKQERQKVIAELEELCENKKITIMQQDVIKTETLDILKLEDLKQKLNEMKGER